MSIFYLEIVNIIFITSYNNIFFSVARTLYACVSIQLYPCAWRITKIVITARNIWKLSIQSEAGRYGADTRARETTSCDWLAETEAERRDETACGKWRWYNKDGAQSRGYEKAIARRGKCMRARKRPQRDGIQSQDEKNNKKIIINCKLLKFDRI